jgi:GNAT superfamily N-acetyltransferase
MEIHILECNQADHVPLIESYVQIAKSQQEHFKAPIPWEGFECKKSKTVFVALANEAMSSAPTIAGWALCYKDPIYRRVYLSALSTRAAMDAKFKGTGTLLMNRIISHFTEAGMSFIYVFPIHQSEGFYKRFGFEPHEADVYYRGLIRDPTDYEKKWLDAIGTMVPRLLYEFGNESPNPLRKQLYRRLTHVLKTPSKANEAPFLEIAERFKEDPDGLEGLDEEFLRDVLRRRR